MYRRNTPVFEKGSLMKIRHLPAPLLVMGMAAMLSMSTISAASAAPAGVAALSGADMGGRPL